VLRRQRNQITSIRVMPVVEEEATIVETDTAL
jgi:hypothetical protein